MRADRPKPQERLATGSLAALLIISPQLMGGALRGTEIAIAALALIALGASLMAARSTEDDPGVGWRATTLRLLWVVLLGWTALQALPLPCSWVGWLAPESVWGVVQSRALLNAPAGAWCTLSWDHGETEKALLGMIAVSAAYLAAGQVAARRGRSVVLRLVAVSTLGIGAATMAHALLGAAAVWGVYTPRFTSTSVLSPLLNANHLAGFCLLGAFVCLGLAVDARSSRRWLWTLGACSLVALLAFSPSGGAIAALAIVFTVSLATLLGRSRRRYGQFALATLVGLGGAALGGYLAGERAWQELRYQDLRKLDLLDQALRFSLTHPWIGVGKGAFSVAFAGFYGTTERYDYAENFILQSAIEYGWPLTVLGCVAGLATLAVTMWKTQHLAVRFACFGLAALLLQNLVDFSLEMHGIAVVAAACVGAVSAEHLPNAPPSSRLLRLDAWLSWRRVGIGVLGAGVVLLALLTPRVLAGSRPELEATLRAQLETRDFSGFKKTLRRALAYHPREPAFAVLAADEAASHNDPRSAAWLRYAAKLAPHWSAVPLIQAKWRWQQAQYRQSLTALRQAAELEPVPAALLTCRMFDAGLLAEDLLREPIPRSNNFQAYLEHLAQWAVAHEAEVALIDAALLQRNPSAIGPRLRRGRRHLQRGAAQQTLAELDGIRAAGNELTELQLLRAAAYLQLRRPAEVRRELARPLRSSAPEDRRRALELIARADAAAGDGDGMRRCIDRLRQLAAGSQNDLAAAEILRSQLESQVNNPASALAALEEAQRLAPTESTLVAIASLASDLGMKLRAFQAYDKLCHDAESAAPYCQRRDAMLHETR